MKVTVIYSCAAGETISPRAYAPKRGDVVPLNSANRSGDYLGRVGAVRRSSRKVEVEIQVPLTRALELPGLTP